MATLGELLQGMGPGVGYPQMAPPMGIPWTPQQQPVAPVQPRVPMGVAPQGRGNVNQDTTGKTMTRAPAPNTGAGYSTPEVMADVKGMIDTFLAGNRARWAEEDRQSYEDARGAENTRPAVLPGSGAQTGDFDPFGNYSPAPPTAASAPAMPTADLAFMLYGGNAPVPPMPERGAAPVIPPVPGRKPDAPAPSGAKAMAKSGPAETSNSKTPSSAPQQSGGGSRSTFQQAPYGESFDPYAGRNNDMGRFLLQAGLNLMVPSWGGPIAQIGKAIGSGAEAVTRGSEMDTKDKVTKQKMDLEQRRINKMGLGKKRASESSSSKRLKAKTPLQEMAANLAPEASLYFTQRMKDLNKAGENDVDEAGNAISPAQKYEKILAETKAMDQKVRAARGQARADEIDDTVLQKVAGTPQESLALSAVAADPVQRALMQKRLEEIKVKKAAANGGK